MLRGVASALWRQQAECRDQVARLCAGGAEVAAGFFAQTFDCVVIEEEVVVAEADAGDEDRLVHREALQFLQ